MLRQGFGIVQCHLFAGNRIFQRQGVPTGRRWIDAPRAPVLVTVGLSHQAK